jgi:hypothetical protein
LALSGHGQGQNSRTHSHLSQNDGARPPNFLLIVCSMFLHRSTGSDNFFREHSLPTVNMQRIVSTVKMSVSVQNQDMLHVAHLTY